MRSDVNQIEDPGRNGWKSSEFGTTIATTASQFLMVFAGIYMLRPEMGLSEDLRSNVVNAILAYIGGSTVTNAVSVWRRTGIKMEAYKALAATSTPITIAPPEPPAITERLTADEWLARTAFTPKH